MVAIVVPFRGANCKQRLGPLADDERAALALAMLDDVLAACVGAGRPVVVTEDELAQVLVASTTLDELRAIWRANHDRIDDRLESIATTRAQELTTHEKE